MSDLTNLAGAKIKIQVNTGTIAAPTWIDVAGQQGGGLRRSAKAIDTSNKTNAGWESSMPGLKNWGMDLDGLMVLSDDSFDLLESAFENDTLIQVCVHFDVTNKRYTGLGAISDFPIDMPYDAAAKYKIKIDGNSPLVRS